MGSVYQHSADFIAALERVMPILGVPRELAPPESDIGGSSAWWRRGDDCIELRDDGGTVMISDTGDRGPCFMIGGAPIPPPTWPPPTATPEEAARACATFLGWTVPT